MWEIVKIEDGKAYLVSKEIWISQRFAESDEWELTYKNSWIRSWLINTWINELFTTEQQAILQGNEACFGDKIFLPSSEEISINNPKPFGLYRYPFCLGRIKKCCKVTATIIARIGCATESKKGKTTKTTLRALLPARRSTKLLSILQTRRLSASYQQSSSSCNRNECKITYAQPKCERNGNKFTR